MKEFSHPSAREKTATDINSALSTTLTVCRNEWKNNCEIDLDLDENLPPVMCLPGEMNQVFLNMIINAAHAIGDKVDGNGCNGGHIGVSTSHNQQWAEIVIKDDGAGIPDDVRARIFDPFFTTKGVGKGTGQGLAISHDIIVRKHNGEIACDSEEGVGTSFRIRLPRQALEM